MKNTIRLFLLILTFFTVPAAANPQGVIVRLATVHAEASSSSERLGQISAGTQVSIFGRTGGWKEIFSEEKSILGWVRSYQVREGKLSQQSQVKAEEDSRGFLAGLASFSRKASRFFSPGGSSASSGTATIGVRGLSEAEIKSAKPDFEELEKMKQFASNKARLKSFRQQGSLSTNEVEYLEPGQNQTSTPMAGGEK